MFLPLEAVVLAVLLAVLLSLESVLLAVLLSLGSVFLGVFLKVLLSLEAETGLCSEVLSWV